MKIFISVLQLRDSGGITPSTLNLLNEIRFKHDVTLCVLSYKSANKVIPSEIHRIDGSSWIRDSLAPRTESLWLNPIQKIRRNIRRILRRVFGTQFIINRGLNEIETNGTYDVAIAYSNNLYCEGKLALGGDYDLVLNKVKAKKKIAWIHNDPYKCGFTYNLCRNMFKDFDAVVCVSKDNQRLLDEIYPEGNRKSFTVYNMYDIQKILRLSTSEPNPYSSMGKIHFVTVARIDNEQKRIDRIVEVCKRLKNEGYDNFDWTVVGEGRDRQAMVKLAAEYELHNLHFIGLKLNPYPYMLHASASVLVSEYEGYGMTVKESQILGTPTIVTNFDCASETVKDGYEGIICHNSTEGVYSAIKNILDNPKQLEVYADYLSQNPVTNDEALRQFNEVIGL